MQKKNGISLIVLVITIIVMIILAASVVVTLNNIGIINKANQAVELQNMSQIENIVSLVWSEAYMNGIKDKEEIKELVIDELKKQNVKTDELSFNITDKGINVSKMEFKVDKLYADILEGVYVYARVMIPVGYTDVNVKFTAASGETSKITKYTTEGDYRIYKMGMIPYIAARDIVAEVYATYNGEEVKIVSEPFCIATYCKSLLAKSDSEIDTNVRKGATMKKVAASMLDYIAGIQVSLNSETTNLANEGVNFENPFVELTYGDRVDTVNKETTTVKNNAFNLSHSATTKIMQRVYAQNKESVTVKIKSENSPEITRTYKDFEDGGTNYYILYTDFINVENYKDIYTFRIYENGELTETITFSIRSFVYVHQNKTESDGTTLTPLAKTVRALWQYYTAIEEYKSL